MRSPLFLHVVVLLLLQGAVSSWAGADPLPLRRFTTYDGLPHESITALAQTPDGRLWVGTRAGLAVYDGRRFEPIVFPDSLRGSGIVKVTSMPDGSVWAVPQNGLGLVQVRGQRVMRVESVPSTGKVRHLLARGDTLVATTQHAVWTLPPGAETFRKHPLPYDVKPTLLLDAHPNSGTGIRGADLGPDGTLWILDGRFGPGRFRLDGSVEFVMDTSAVEDLWASLDVCADGRVLLTRRGRHRLWVYNPDDGSRRVLLSDLKGANYVMRRGHTAYVTDARGFRRVDLRTNTRRPPLNAALGLPEKRPTEILQDRAGTLWIGTRSGLVQLYAPTVRHVRSVKGQQITYANRFMTGVDGELWIQTYGSGLVRLRPTRRQVTPDGVDEWGGGIRSADGRVYAIASDGWYRRDPSSSSEWRRMGTSDGAVRGYVGADGIGYFWHDNGVFRHVPNTSKSPHPLFRWPQEDRAYYQLTRSPSGRLFVRARATLLEVHPERRGPVQIDTVAHLPGFEEIGGRYMTASSTGDIWIVAPDRARRGLLHVNIEQPQPHLHLSGESVYDVSLSGDSLVLAAARSGLFLLDAQTGAERQHLTRNDGLLNTYVKDAALVGDSLYVSHEAGFTVLPHEHALDRPSPPAATITGLMVRHEPHPVRDTLSLAASERTIDVDYAAPYLPNPDRVTFEYRLHPRDTTWHVTDRPTRQFAALGPGRHRFEVRARLGPATGPPARVIVSIAPFFYETWWFWGLCAFGLVGLVGLGYRWRLRHLHRREAALEEAVTRRTRQLRAEKEKTEAQAERLTELDEAKNRFFANLSHEFRTPLTLITEPLRSLLREPDDSPAGTLRGRLRPMLRNAQRLERLIGQLLTLSKSTAGRLELNRQPVDLVALARESCEAFAPLAERRDLELRFRSEVDTLPAVVDPDKLDKILSNLLSNAIKFTEAGGTVWLTVSRGAAEKGGARLVVKDTGIGIAQDDLRRIFDRFEQVDGSTTRPEEGTGIGLALTRDLVELHDGTIGVESEPGKGSAFVVHLPLGHTEVEEDIARGNGVSDDRMQASMTADPPPSVSTTDAPSAEEGDAPTLLVVDDNADVRSFLRRELGDAYEITTAGTGTEALDRMRDAPPDVVVSDVMMPEMDGFALCEAIKANDDLCTIPVLLLTARAEVDDTVEGLECGADDYLTKPFDVRELKTRVGRLLEARATLRSEYEQIVRLDDVDLEVPDAEAAFVEAVLTAVRASIDDPDFTVDRLADAVALSRRQLTRRLREATGESPADFIRRFRLERAADRLASSENVRIADIAYAVGFRTVSHFSKAFKKHFGCPPSQYPDES